jgi:hypothetical protein
VGAAGTFWLDGLQRGTPVMEGSARGTALVMLVLAVPTLLAGLAFAARGSVRGLFAWLGACAYITYNALLLLLAMPFNALFLVYEAMLGLSLATLAAGWARVDPRAVAAALPRAPARALSAYMGSVVVLNTLAWLGAVVPELGTRGTPRFLVGSGLTTNPVYVFDLAVWLPLAGVAAVWLWQRRPVGYLLAGGILVLWLIESIGVATDQWFGSRADPESVIATTEGVYLFAALSAVALVAVLLLLRRVVPAVDPR